MESDGPSPKRIRRELVGGEGEGRERRDDGHRDSELRDHFNAVAAISTLRRVGDGEVFLRDVDLFTMQFPQLHNDLQHLPPLQDELQYPPLNNDRSIMNFHLTCHHRGNISALFLQGCSEFFYRHDLENGLSMIRQAALRGYELAIYVYNMLRRILTPTEEIDLELNNPNRDLIRRMRRRMEDSSHYYWGPRRMPVLYLDRCASFDSSFIRRCHCAWNNSWCPLWEESVKDPWMCDTCFYAIHVLGFIRFILHRVMQWSTEYSL